VAILYINPVQSNLKELMDELDTVHQSMGRAEIAYVDHLTTIPQEQRASAANLLHYLALRRHDLRQAQPRLAALGLSSLGRTESHVQSGLEAVLRALHALDGRHDWNPSGGPATLTVDRGEELLSAHTEALLGVPPQGRSVRIMVTMPTEASTDYALVRDLVAGGMDCMRINCAHDDQRAWEAMVHHLDRARRELGRSCRICMDIAGPKLRTGPIEPGPAVLKIKPRRDRLGNVIAPARVALVPATSTAAITAGVDEIVPIDAAVPESVGLGDVIRFEDTRGRRRRLVVYAREGSTVLAELDRTAYLGIGDTLHMANGSPVDTTRTVTSVRPLEQKVMLRKGDTLLLTPDILPARPALRDQQGRVLAPARVGVSLDQIFSDVRPDEAVWFDDGRIGGIVRAVNREQITVEITHAPGQGARLAAGKGINLPDTALRLAALTPEDIANLSFIAEQADLVAYSFVRDADDVRAIQEHLGALHAEQLGIVLKIETRHAFTELPNLLLACMRTGRFGVMIARGDLAVECGFERMAEVQEEILWICEAAHTPVIWATQVLESLAKTGIPSRAEVTDAAMSERAECVMLNKGPYIRDAVHALDDILKRMQAHQTKKRALLRPLHVVNSVLSDLSPSLGSADLPRFAGHMRPGSNH
jgi:pyruvate kinase